MINWHLEPRSRRLLAKVRAANVERVTRVAVPCDYVAYAGQDRAATRLLGLLEARRTRAVERAAGGTFLEVEARGSGWDYINADKQAPSLTQAIEGSI
jgi:hypothetical protein